MPKICLNYCKFKYGCTNRKIGLAKRLLETDDEAILLEIKGVFESHDKDFWDDLPEHVKAGIERGKKQAAESKLTPHDEVMKKYAKYL